MAITNSTGARLRAVSTSPAGNGDSDPNPDELLKRVHNPRSGLSPKGRAALASLSAFEAKVNAERAEQRRAEENIAWDEFARGVAA